jgi:hypothetical protein
LARQGLGQEEVVGIEEGHDLAARRRDSAVAGGSRPGILLSDQPDAIGERREGGGGVVGGTVVDHDDLDGRVGLIENAANGFHDETGPIVGGDDHADRRLARHPAPSALL